MPQRLGPLYLSLAAAIWGGMYVVSKVVLERVPPLGLVWLRYAVALVALLLMGIATKQPLRLARRHLPLVAAVGAIGYFASIWAQFAGTAMTSAQMGSVITSATPAFMVIFARLLLKEQITPGKALSVLMATAGVLVISGVGGMDGSSRLGGVVLAVAALTWALMSVLVKLIPKGCSQLVVTTYAIAVAIVIMTPLAVPQMAGLDPRTFLDPVLWGGVLYLGVVSTAGAFFLWNKGLQMVDASRGGVFFFLQPVVGTLLGWAFLGEQVGAPFAVGSVLILGGVLLTMKEEAFHGRKASWVSRRQ